MALPGNDPETPAHKTPHNARVMYLGVFAALAVFTALEVGVSRPQLGIGKAPMVAALVALALAKAGLVAFYFMHLRHEMRALRWTVLSPFVLPVLYTLALILEAGWRLAR